MNGLISWFARNGVAANLLMALILVGGIATAPTLKQEVFPELPSGLITVTVEYLGAAPDEIEESICARIEENLQGISGVKRIRSNARESLGSVNVELLSDADSRTVLEDVKSRVDAIDTFPDDAERPVVSEVILRRQVLNVAVSGNTDETGLRAIADEIRDEISMLPGISLVLLGNAKPYEISIEVSEETLRRHGITLDLVAAAIRRSSFDLPGGSVKTAGGEVLVRTKGQAYRGPDFADISVLSRRDGTRLRLGDIAAIIDGFADTDQSTRFDGDPSMLVQVFRVGDQGALEVAEQVYGYIEQKTPDLPEGIQLTTWQDDSKMLRSRLDLMIRNGRMGLVFVFASLALFLRLRLAFWVALGIPISFMGAVWLLPATGVSINLISLFAFIVVLGIVVDDAIVVGENIYSRLQRGERGVEAAIAGAREVGTPVSFAVLTTIAAFLPLLLVPGRYGDIMAVIPSVVILTLVFSLIESLFVLPRHLSHFRYDAQPRGLGRLWGGVQSKVTGTLEWFVDRFYRPTLEKAIRWRYLTLAIGLSLLIGTMGVVAGGWIKFTFFPRVDADNVAAYITMPQGTPIEETERAAATIERAARELREELREELRALAERDDGDDADSIDPYRHVMKSLGGQPFREAQAQNRGQIVSFAGGHLAEINLELLPSEERSISSKEIAQRWRDKAGPIPGAEEVFYSSDLFSAGDDVNVQLASSDPDQLLGAAESVKKELRAYDGVVDVADSFRAGKRELRLDILPAAENLGLTLADLARQVRQGFYGEEAQRIQRGRDDVKVMVRYPESERRSVADVERMRIRTPDGGEVPFPSVARVQPDRGYSVIERSNRQRVVTVTAGVDADVANAREINQELASKILPEVLRDFPAVSFGFEGDQREQADAMAGLAQGAMIAIVLIYALLAIPFRSYFQPFIVMSAIPFGIVGAVWGHLILDLDLTFLSIFGLVALTGVLVNDSLVMVDFINRHRDQGKDLFDAIRTAGVVRFRPILLTSVTTFAGLTPLLFEKSLQAKFLIPMAASLGFGVLFATFITLILVPVGYYLIEDLKAVLSKVFFFRPAEPVSSTADTPALSGTTSRHES